MRVIRRLAERHDVALLYLRESGAAPPEDEIVNTCALVEEIQLPAHGATRRRVGLALSLARGRPMEVFLSASGEFGRRVHEVGARWQPDVVEAELTRMAQYLPCIAGSARTVVVAYEADAASAADAFATARGRQKIFRAADLRAWRHYEPRALGFADAVVTFSDRDREIVQRVTHARTVVTIPLRVDVPSSPFNPLGTTPPTVLFVGGFGHPPNVEAAVRLAARIFPLVRSRHPDARLEIVGPDPPAAVAALAGNGVSILGRVPDVEPHLDRAAVVVAPIASGGGVRIKVLEALAAGKAVVASTRALEGIPIAPDREAIVADDDSQFAAAIVLLLQAPAERRRLASAARSWAEGHSDPDDSARDFENLYQRLLDP
jgi:polysaccharide biosynthesis protein PslH